MIKLLITVDRELYGDKNGAGPDWERETAGPSDPDDFLALVKDQSEGHRTTKTVAEEALGKVPGKYLVSHSINGDIYELRPLWKWGI